MIPFTPVEAAPSFDHPLEMLHACHDKILRQCDTLKKLAAHLPGNGCDQQARQAAQGILRYFDSAGNSTIWMKKLICFQRCVYQQARTRCNWSHC